MPVDRNGLEILDRDECMRLLATATIGRIGSTAGALPTVLPVNFRLIDSQIVISTGTGARFDAASRGQVVAFEADEFDPLFHEGWSVMVTGVARVVTDPAERRALSTVPLARWAPRGGGEIVTISTEMISGRRIRADAALADLTSPEAPHRR